MGYADCASRTLPESRGPGHDNPPRLLMFDPLDLRVQMPQVDVLLCVGDVNCQCNGSTSSLSVVRGLPSQETIWGQW